MKSKISALGAAIAATLGAQTADATTYSATLTAIQSFSGNGSSAGEFGTSTATWQYDDVTNLLTSPDGTFNVRFSISPGITTLFRHSITGLVLGNGGAATASAYSCKEGNFGTNVGASLCGNYNFGANFSNQSSSTWGPGTDFARTTGGDDMALGPQQNISAYDGFATISWVGTTLTLSNASCNPVAPGNASGCATLPSNNNTGYTWVLDAGPQVSSAPTAVADEATTTRNVATNIAVLDNDANLTLPATVTADATGTNPTANATIVVNGDNTITYTPSLAAGTAGPVTDTFTYTVTSEDPDLTATVTVTINNTVPTATGTPAITISTQGVAPDAASGTFTAPGTGAGVSLGDATAVVSAGDGSQGTTAESGNTITYTPGAGFFEGSDTFTYQITDGDGEISTADVTVNIPDLTPALAGGSGETGIDEAETFDLTAGLTAGNGSLAQHTLAVATNGSDGDCAINGTTLTYTPDAGFSGSDSCEVSITDGDGDTSNATYTIEVAAAGGLRDSSGGSSSLDLGILSLFGAAALLRRRRRA